MSALLSKKIRYAVGIFKTEILYRRKLPVCETMVTPHTYGVELSGPDRLENLGPSMALQVKLRVKYRFHFPHNLSGKVTMTSVVALEVTAIRGDPAVLWFSGSLVSWTWTGS